MMIGLNALRRLSNPDTVSRTSVSQSPPPGTETDSRGTFLGRTVRVGEASGGPVGGDVQVMLNTARQPPAGPPPPSLGERTVRVGEASGGPVGGDVQVTPKALERPPMSGDIRVFRPYCPTPSDCTALKLESGEALSLQHLEKLFPDRRETFVKLHHLRVHTPEKDPSFINFGHPQLTGSHYGAKLHISINKDQLYAAQERLLPLLLSEDNPFPKFKITNPRNIANRLREEGPDTPADLYRRDRITDGMQITLYPYTTTPDFSDVMGRCKAFVHVLEQELDAGQIGPGRRPESDVALEGCRFVSYRSERHGERGSEAGEAPVGEEVYAALRDSPFYRQFVNTTGPEAQPAFGLAVAGVRTELDRAGRLGKYLSDFRIPSETVLEKLTDPHGRMQSAVTALEALATSVRPELEYGEAWAKQTRVVADLAKRMRGSQFKHQRGSFPMYALPRNNPFRILLNEKPELRFALRFWLADGIGLIGDLLEAQARPLTGRQGPLTGEEMVRLYERVEDFAASRSRLL